MLLDEVGCSDLLRVMAHDYGARVLPELVATSAIVLLQAVCPNGGTTPDGHRPRLAQRILAFVGAVAAPLVSRAHFAVALRSTFAIRPPNLLLDDMLDIVFDHGEFVAPSPLSYSSAKAA